MLRAMIAGVFVAILAPLIGTFLVSRRFSLFSDTLSHIALTGVAIGVVTGIEPIVSTLLITILSSVVLEKLRSSNKLPAEAILALFLPAGLAIAVMIISLNKRQNINLSSYLFGSISTITNLEVIIIGILSALTLIGVLCFYRQLLYTSFDQDGARLNGINTKIINYGLMISTAITVSITMRVIGVLLVGALMVIPVVTAMRIAKSFRQILLYAVFISIFAVLSGLVIAFQLNLPAGASIVVMSVLIFILSIFLSR